MYSVLAKRLLLCKLGYTGPQADSFASLFRLAPSFRVPPIARVWNVKERLIRI